MSQFECLVISLFLHTLIINDGDIHMFFACNILFYASLFKAASFACFIVVNFPWFICVTHLCYANKHIVIIMKSSVHRKAQLATRISTIS